jgi:hypothetical protein
MQSASHPCSFTPQGKDFLISIGFMGPITGLGKEVKKSLKPFENQSDAFCYENYVGNFLA